MIFRLESEKNKLVKKNMKYEKYEEILDRVKEEVGKTSLGLIEK